MPTPDDRATATTTFVCEIDGRDFYVRTGDSLRTDHPVVQAHPTRFDHHVPVETAPPSVV